MYGFNCILSAAYSKDIVAFLIDIGRVSQKISCQGEIRREYELHILKLEEEARKKREVECRASEELIRKIQVGCKKNFKKYDDSIAVVHDMGARNYCFCIQHFTNMYLATPWDTVISYMKQYTDD
jgi:hypothetical protein